MHPLLYNLGSGKLCKVAKFTSFMLMAALVLSALGGVPARAGADSTDVNDSSDVTVTASTYGPDMTYVWKELTNADDFDWAQGNKGFAVDVSDGVPYMAYISSITYEGQNSSEFTKKLHVLKYVEEEWTVIGEGEDFWKAYNSNNVPTAVEYVSLAVIGGTPYVAYSQSYSKIIVDYYDHDTSTWVQLFETDQAINGSYVTLSADVNGDLYLLYRNQTSAHVRKYDMQTGGFDSSRGLDVPGGTNIFIAFDGATPYVSYTVNYEDLQVLTYQGGQWQADARYNNAAPVKGVTPHIAVYEGALFLSYLEAVEIEENQYASFQYVNGELLHQATVGFYGSFHYSEMNNSEGRLLVASEGVLKQYDEVEQEWAAITQSFAASGFFEFQKVIFDQGEYYVAYLDARKPVLKKLSAPDGPDPEPEQRQRSSYTGPVVQELTVDVDNGHTGSGEVLVKTTIKRTTNESGTVIDEVVFTVANAREIADKLKGAGTARIVAPDPEDQVSELTVPVTREALSVLVDNKIDLEIFTDNVRIVIPWASMANYDDDFYFRVVPVKAQGERRQFEERARLESVVRQMADDREIVLAGRPMTIETNMQNHPVTLVLPLGDDSVRIDGDTHRPIVFIEHSNGDKQIADGAIVSYTGESKTGIEFKIDHFSTFAVLYVEAEEEAAAEAEQPEPKEHLPYIFGFGDRTFKPEDGVTRAQMALMLSAVLGSGAAAPAGGLSYADVPTGHWAAQAISAAGQAGLMSGVAVGEFAPEQTVTRAQMAAIVDRWINHSGGGLNVAYTDVTPEHWAYEAIARAGARGVMIGFGDGSFQPEKTLTRAEAVVVLNQLLGRGSLGGLTPTFADVPAGHWAFGAIEEAARAHKYVLDENGAEILAN